MAKRLKAMGLVRGRHFTVRMPKGGGMGYVLIPRDGLEQAAWLSVHGKGRRQRMAAEFIVYILRRARERGEEVYEKALEVVEAGRARGSMGLAGVKGREVEVNNRKHVVTVVGGAAELDRSQSGKPLLRIKITAEVDGVKNSYTITFGRYSKDNKISGFAMARADAPGGKEADAERLAALVKALTGKEPWTYHMKDGRIAVICGRKHLDGLARYAELAEAIAKWLDGAV